MNKNKIEIISFKPLRGFFYLIIGVFMLLALIDFQPEKSSFYTVSNVIKSLNGNRFGILGINFCFYACRYFGIMAWMFPVYSLWIGGCMISGFSNKIQQKNIFSFIFLLLFGSSLFAFLQAMHWVRPNYLFYSAGNGGVIGIYLVQGIFKDYCGTIGSAILLIPATFICLLLSFSKLEHLPINMQTLLKKILQWSIHLSNILLQVFQNFKIPNKFFGYVLRFLNFWRSYFYAKKKTEINKTELYRISNLNDDSTNLNAILQTNQSTGIFSESDNFFEKQYFYTNSQTNKDTGIFKEKQLNSKEIGKKQQKVAETLTPIHRPVDEKSDKPIEILASEKMERSTKKMPSYAGQYQLPSLELLKPPPPVLQDANTEDYYETAKHLVQKLAEFGVEIKIEAIQSGPVITRYEVTPARGVRVEKIETLDKNIALGLKALSVRIQAPVPGKGCVGIEIPNKKPIPVCLQEILASKAWEQSDAEIPIVLGKEVTGKPIITDLTKMPHLLIAGSTGSGKTVCINAIIASLLFRATPQNLRFIMVDPKIVEMKIYNDLPHMLIPVVTDPKRVPGALKWLIAEMERRYQLFANYGARNIATFNSKIATLSASDHVEHLPYIICIIDELADLMMVTPGDIETCIARLAQLARAAGIHLIIATQRPSVNVITGIIKANLPSRIAFKVASKIDSRTILDVGGADSLIGKGDMLFIPPGASQLIRAQGAWVSDDEINNLVEFLKCNGAPNFSEDVQQMINGEEDKKMSENSPMTSDDEDVLLPQALDILKTSDRVSTSLLQRRLKIGYNRAARIMEMLDKRGLIPKNFE